MAIFDKGNNLSQRMTQALGRAIVCGEYDRNESLPTEAELCTQFGVSRSAVREAVKMLSAKGLISSRPRQGIRILRSEEHTSELQSRGHFVCRLLLEKK